MGKRNNIYSTVLITIVFVSLSVSCAKMETDSGKDYIDNITFQVVTADEALVTKAEYNNGNLPSITLFGKKSNNDQVFGAESIVILRPANDNPIWKPDQHYIWEDNVGYSFHAYAHTPVPAGGSIMVNNEGKNISIVQPGENLVDGAKSQTIDYLLSHYVNYEASTNHEVVPIVLEHAFCKVSLYVLKGPSLSTSAQSGKKISITDLRVSFDNISNKCDMTCTPKIYGNDNQERNLWTSVIDKGKTVSYSMSVPSAEKNDELIKVEKPSEPLLSFIALPNDHQGIMNYTLSISYNVAVNDDAPIPYSQTYELKKMTGEWQRGHQIIYVFTIDNSIHLTGSIEDWTKVPYIEGTVLPPTIIE